MTSDDSARGRVLSLMGIGGAAEAVLGGRAVQCVQTRGRGTLALAAGLHQVVGAKLSKVEISSSFPPGIIVAAGCGGGA